MRPRARARPAREVGRDAARVVPRGHPRARADRRHRGRRGRRRHAHRHARRDHGRGRALLRLPALERRGGRPGAAPPARAVPAAPLRGEAPGGRAEQGDHLPVPRGRPPDRDGGDGEHGRADRARSRARPRRGAAAEPRAPRRVPVHLRHGQRLRQRELPRGPGDAPAAGGVRGPAARAGPRARGGARGRHRARVLRRADGAGRPVLRDRRGADLGPGGDDGAPGALGGRHRAHGAHRPGPGHAHRARPDRRRRARRARRVRRRRLGGHRGRTVVVPGRVVACRSVAARRSWPARRSASA